MEFVFRNPAGIAARFIVSGLDLDRIPSLPFEKYPDGLYMPMGIGTPPFFQTYDELAKTPIDGTYDSRTCGGQPVRKPTRKVVSVFKVQVSGNELTMTDAKGASGTYQKK